jgi:hypothetical protein
LARGEQLHVWRFTHRAAAGMVQGPAVAFAALVGVPFVRLRLAIPGRLFGGDADAALAAAIGSDAGFEQAARDVHGNACEKSPLLLTVVAADVQNDGDARDASLPIASSPDELQVSSTALMHALLLSRCLMSSTEIVQAQAAYLPLLARHSEAWPSMYLRLFEAYKVLLQGTLFCKTGWLLKADAFRIILLAQATAVAGAGGGPSSGAFWDSTDELAVALHARTSDAQPVAPRGLRLVLQYVQAAAMAAVSYFLNQSGAAAVQAGGDATATTAAARDAVDATKAPDAKGELDAHEDVVPRHKLQQQNSCERAGEGDDDDARLAKSGEEDHPQQHARGAAVALARRRCGGATRMGDGAHGGIPGEQ